MTNQTVIVIAVPARGAMQLDNMLYFWPSRASVLVSPKMPAFAAEYYGRSFIGDMIMCICAN